MRQLLLLALIATCYVFFIQGELMGHPANRCRTVNGNEVYELLSKGPKSGLHPYCLSWRNVATERFTKTVHFIDYRGRLEAVVIRLVIIAGWLDQQLLKFMPFKTEAPRLKSDHKMFSDNANRELLPSHVMNCKPNTKIARI
ncbi:hypothetical protein L596_016810 [Steinernema carpocapsae]|uniref:Uncharacterized protein n=1 Tax=Steinernema carpocapsae TaxID=34508 RepID=A0A4U5NKC3_STECR|nr:hypothetical protein L596_016810 [Steinernema carpocapsae]